LTTATPLGLSQQARQALGGEVVQHAPPGRLLQRHAQALGLLGGRLGVGQPQAVEPVQRPGHRRQGRRLGRPGRADHGAEQRRVLLVAGRQPQPPGVAQRRAGQRQHRHGDVVRRAGQRPAQLPGELPHRPGQHAQRERRRRVPLGQRHRRAVEQGGLVGRPGVGPQRRRQRLAGDGPLVGAGGVHLPREHPGADVLAGLRRQRPEHLAAQGPAQRRGGLHRPLAARPAALAAVALAHDDHRPVGAARPQQGREQLDAAAVAGPADGAQVHRGQRQRVAGPLGAEDRAGQLLEAGHEAQAAVADVALAAVAEAPLQADGGPGGVALGEEPHRPGVADGLEADRQG
jgi:hypothetical protein